MTPRTEAALGHWTRAREEYERAKSRVASAAQLFVQDRLTLPELREYVDKMIAAERATDDACRVYRKSYAFGESTGPT